MNASDENTTINIVFAADANYAIPLATALCSVAVNCDRSRKLCFYVLQSGFDAELRGKVERSLARLEFPSAGICWLEAPIERISGFKLAHRYTTYLTFARLLLPELLPDVPKVIYLDCDLVVIDDVAQLWDMELDGKALGAIRDSTGSVSEPDGLLNYRELGIPAEAHYFNAGVLVINLEKWRRERVGERALTYLSTHGDIIQMADQEALNAVLWEDWKELDYRWNWQIQHRDCRKGRTKLVWSPDTTRKSIIHFTTGEKPWLPACGYEEKKFFQQYLDRTEWAGLRVSTVDELLGQLKWALRDLRFFLRGGRRAA